MCVERTKNMNDYERLLDAYNDYIEYEFQERRNTKLDIKLGLMYTTDDLGNEVEFYYDTQSKVFYGFRNDELIYELKANFDEATTFIETHDFEDYYNLIAEDEDDD